MLASNFPPTTNVRQTANLLITVGYRTALPPIAVHVNVSMFYCRSWPGVRTERPRQTDSSIEIIKELGASHDTVRVDQVYATVFIDEIELEQLWSISGGREEARNEGSRRDSKGLEGVTKKRRMTSDVPSFSSRKKRS